MKISELKEKLNIAKGCLNKSYVSSVLSHFCFTGEEVYSCNVAQAVGIPLRTDIKAAIPGDILFKMINSLDEDKDVSLSYHDSKITLHTDKSIVELPSLPETDFIFSKPSLKKAVKISITQDFIDAIKRCLISTSEKSFIDVSTGIFFDGEFLYATDNVSISRYKLKSPIKEISLFLPKAFCDQLLKGFDTTGDLFFTDDFVYFTSGEVWGYSKLPEGIISPDFKKFFSNIDFSYAENNSIYNPEEIASVIDRSMILCDLKKGGLKIETDRNSIYFKTTGDMGYVLDTIGSDKSLSPASAVFDPSLIKRCLPLRLSLVPHKDTFILVGVDEDFVYVLQALWSENKEH